MAILCYFCNSSFPAQSVVGRGHSGPHSASLELWLRGGLEIGGRRQRVTPGDIAVLYPRRRPDAVLHSRSSSYVEELYRALGTVPP